jgi:aminoglycoside phosphotransferase (APT) family kinase protein
MTLAARIGAALGVAIDTLEPLPGGHSGLTYTVKAGADSYVVKAVPPGQKPVGRNDMLRQARVLRALEGSSVPVPRVVAVDEDSPAWFAMELVAGEAIEPVLDEHALAPELCRTRMLTAATILRRLHDQAIGWASAAGGEWRPPRGQDAAEVSGAEASVAARELARWSRTMHAVPVELRPGGEELLAALAVRVPGDLPPVLVHGDFRLGNVLFAGEQARAVVDWEIWSVGDRRVDLGWFLLFADHENFPALGNPVPGLPSEAELLDAYVGAGPVELPDMRWFRALGRMKMAAIMGHNLRRHREGKHHDPDQERLPPTIAAMIRAGLELLT